jgi:hypothetical protein
LKCPSTKKSIHEYLYGETLNKCFSSQKQNKTTPKDGKEKEKNKEKNESEFFCSGIFLVIIAPIFFRSMKIY